jgi:hypothetical protein
MKSEFRESAYDAPLPRKPKVSKPGTIPDHKIEVLDHLGRHRGMVTRSATSATASRFLNGRSATLQKVKGKDCWIGDHPFREK